MLSRQTKEGQRLLDGFLNPGGQARIADRPFSQPRGEMGLRPRGASSAAASLVRAAMKSEVEK